MLELIFLRLFNRNGKKPDQALEIRLRGRP